GRRGPGAECGLVSPGGTPGPPGGRKGSAGSVDFEPLGCCGEETAGTPGDGHGLFLGAPGQPAGPGSGGPGGKSGGSPPRADGGLGPGEQGPGGPGGALAGWGPLVPPR